MPAALERPAPVLAANLLPVNNGIDERILRWAGTDFRSVGGIVSLPNRGISAEWRRLDRLQGIAGDLRSPSISVRGCPSSRSRRRHSAEIPGWVRRRSAHRTKIGPGPTQDALVDAVVHRYRLAAKTEQVRSSAAGIPGRMPG